MDLTSDEVLSGKTTGKSHFHSFLKLYPVVYIALLFRHERIPFQFISNFTNILLLAIICQIIHNAIMKILPKSKKKGNVKLTMKIL